ncbi:unnamed protein product [Musa acuminata subsp. burmannicoides]
MGGFHRFYGTLQNPWKHVLGTRPGLVFVNQFVKPDETLDKAMATDFDFTGAFLTAVPGVDRWVVEHGEKLIWRDLIDRFLELLMKSLELIEVRFANSCSIVLQTMWYAR